MDAPLQPLGQIRDLDFVAYAALMRISSCLCGETALACSSVSRSRFFHCGSTANMRGDTFVAWAVLVSCDVGSFCGSVRTLFGLFLSSRKMGLKKWRWTVTSRDMLRFCREKCCGEVLEEFRAEVRGNVAENKFLVEALKQDTQKIREKCQSEAMRHVKTKQRWRERGTYVSQGITTISKSHRVRLTPHHITSLTSRITKMGRQM